MKLHMDGLVHEGCNSSANALEWNLSCTNPSVLYLLHKKSSEDEIWDIICQFKHWPILHIYQCYAVGNICFTKLYHNNDTKLY